MNRRTRRQQERNLAAIKETKAASIANEHATVRAALACKASKKSDPAAFKTKYKTFGRCVATLAKSK